MSYIRTRKSTPTLLIGTALAMTLMSGTALAGPAGVANPGLKFPVTQSISYSAPLLDLSGQDAANRVHVLDWRTPEMELSFELSDADRADDLEVLLSLSPILSAQNPSARPGRNSKIKVYFNNAPAQTLSSNGYRFDARVNLSAAHIRPQGNVLRIAYETPQGAECVLPQHGGWTVDLKQSKLVVRGRAKTRALQLREVESRLDQAALAPRRVGLIASGPNATHMQALAAQGIGLRMNRIPSFDTRPGIGDFEIIMARRDKLPAGIDRTFDMNVTGANIFVPKSRPMRLVITGDTDAQVMQSVTAFSTRHLPQTRRTKTSLGEVSMQRTLAADIIHAEGVTKLSELNGAAARLNWTKGSWANGPQAMRFNVSDPVATSGEVLLRLNAGVGVAKDSKLRVAINGETLGYTKLDKRQKTVAFDLSPGQLVATDNVLTLTPELQAKPGIGCAMTHVDQPGFTLGAGSKLKLSNPNPSPSGELSRLAATGAPFSDLGGSNSYIALPKGQANYNASLKVLAHMAHTSGETLHAATFRRGEVVNADAKHVLYIGPANQMPREIRAAAPLSFKAAMSGQPARGENLRMVELPRFADLSEFKAFDLAARETRKARINAGGVAALFASPYGNGQAVGVITQSPGARFTLAMDQLVADERWNGLEGSVARWDRRSVITSQTAQAIPGYSLPQAPSSGFDLPELKFANLNLDAISRDMETGFSAISNKAVTLVADARTKFDAMTADWRSGSSQGAGEYVTANPAPAVPNFSKVEPKISKVEPKKPVISKRAELAPKPAAVATKTLPKTVELRGSIPTYQPRKTFRARWNGFVTDLDRNLDLMGSRMSRAVDNIMGRGQKTHSLERAQSRIIPAQHSLRARVNDLPGAKFVKTVHAKMGWATIFLILSFAIACIMVGFASPRGPQGSK